MGSVIRTVSLDNETAEKASEMDNFSLYIRECLSGEMHIRHEAMKRQVQHLISIIRIARDLGSMHPTFKKAVAELIL